MDPYRTPALLLAALSAALVLIVFLILVHQ